MSENSHLWAAVDRIVRDQFGKEQAVLVFDNGQQLVLPLNALPSGVQPQQLVAVQFQIDLAESARRAGQVENIQRQLFDE